jgi:hypothetical protein
MQLEPNFENQRESRQPLRQFVLESPKGPSIFRQQVAFWWYAIMPALIIAAISACEIWAGFRHFQSTDKHPPSYWNPKEKESLLDSANLGAEFIDRYIKAKYSEEMNLSEKMTVTGTYADENGIKAFRGTFDFRGNGKFQIESIETVELEFLEGNLVSKVSPLFESDASAIEAFVDAMQDPIMRLKHTPNVEPPDLKSTQYMGVEAYETYIESSEQQISATLTIDPSSLTTLELINHLPTKPAQKYRYSEYRRVAGIRLPHVISIKDQWGELGRISLASLKLAN